MEYIIYAIVLAVSAGLFLPKYGGERRNVPIFVIIASIIAIRLIIMLLKYVLLVFKVKKLLTKNGYTITQMRFAPKLRNEKCYHISGIKDGKTVNVYITKRRNSYVTYHFESENKALLYKHTRLAIKPAVRQAYIVSHHVERKTAGEEHFFWQDVDFNENTENILLFKKLPNTVTDTKSQIPLANGDKILDKVILYDIKGYASYINSQK